MKTIFTFLICILMSTMYAQDRMFVHTATSANSSGEYTLLDHPLLNGNPNAKLLISHVWNPPGEEPVYNNKVTGVYYSSSTENRWIIYNEDDSEMVAGVSYFVYVADTNAILHIATEENQGEASSYSVVDFPAINSNPNAIAVMTNNYYTSWNPYNYGFWFDGNNWIIYKENDDAIAIGSSYFVATTGGGAVGYRHQADDSNIVLSTTTIDHPLLNGNPNAKFVCSHNWGQSDASSNVVLDKVLGTYYNGEKWTIYLEDLSSMPVGATFDLLIDENSMGVKDEVLATKVTAFPNPVVDQVNFTSAEKINEIRIYNMAGQEINKTKGNSNQISIDMSLQPKGVYIATIQMNKEVKTIKLSKK